jgi:hypothetical protein
MGVARFAALPSGFGVVISDEADLGAYGAKTVSSLPLKMFSRISWLLLL